MRLHPALVTPARIFTIAALLLAAPLTAAQNENDTANSPDSASSGWSLDQRYEQLFAGMLASPGDVDFQALRAAWARHETYDPYLSRSTGFQNALIALNGAIEQRRFTEAASLCRLQLDRYWIEPDWQRACEKAYLQSRDSIQATVHRSIPPRNLSAILDSGDGLTPATAFRVVTTGEPPRVLATMGYTVRTRGLVQHDGATYELVTVKEDPIPSSVEGEDPEPRRFWFDVAPILSWLDRNVDAE
ncbi:hypothetical protein ABI59_09065 [Acidobacteria bacterium Mor1]|nr:hypothetical protein ABI59_09065 [Acidobacteria bacterium Mor1]